MHLPLEQVKEEDVHSPDILEHSLPSGRRADPGKQLHTTLPVTFNLHLCAHPPLRILHGFAAPKNE